MSRRSRTLIDRLAMTALAAIAISAAPGQPAVAAGCHVPDRPALGLPLALDLAGRIELPGRSHDQTPPIVRRIPCSGEVPSMPVVSSVLIGPAMLGAAGRDCPATSETCSTADVVVRPVPHALRLDRPPRAPVTSVR